MTPTELCARYLAAVEKCHGPAIAAKSEARYNAGWYYVKVGRLWPPTGQIVTPSGPGTPVRKNELIEMAENLEKRAPNSD